MTYETILELVGYFGSLLVLVSLLMSSAVRLRIINGIGSLIFAVYALLIHSYPTAVMNACLVVIDLYFLVKLLRQKTLFTLRRGTPTESCCQYFLERCQEDIRSFFPDFDFRVKEDAVVYYVFAGEQLAGLLIGRMQGRDTMQISLDYSTPAYRDCSVGTFLYQELAGSGVKTLKTEGQSEKHGQYLQKMGFVKQGNTYTKTM